MEQLNLYLTTREENRERGRRLFLPVAGVPRSRSDCPKDRPCPHVRCEWHLWRIDNENRQGRPGLSSVPRGPDGTTLSTPGHAGDRRAGTTLAPRWLEYERRCEAVLVTGDDVEVEVDEGRWAALRLREGDTLSVEGDGYSARARVGKQFVLDARPPLGRLAVTLTRVRPVPSCGLDLIEQKGRMGNVEIGEAIGRHRTLAAKEIKQALRKAAKEAQRQGISVADFVNALKNMGAR